MTSYVYDVELKDSGNQHGSNRFPVLVLQDAGLGEQEISIQTGHTKIIIQINTTLYPLGQLLFTT